MVININGMEVTLERRKVKNINLYVKPPDGHILVTAPRSVSQKKICEFILSRQSWIERAQKRVQEKAQKKIDIMPEEITKEDIKRLQGWIEKYAAEWEPKLGVKCNGWTIRYMKTRWGSCSIQKKTIRINSRLAKKDEKIAELVIVHELIHLIVAGHDKKFYGYLEHCLPDWRERQKILRS